MSRYFVIDFKKWRGREAFKNVLSGHNARKRKASRPYVDKQKKNIELSPLKWGSYEEMMEELNSKAKISGGRKLRKGSSEIFSIVIDASKMKGWTTDKYIEYLKEAEKWLRHRFHGHPIIHSAIHMDETKPHLHIAFSYFNEERGRWSQKHLAQQKLTDLNKLLSDFENDIGNKYGLRRGDGISREKKKIKQEIVKSVEIRQTITLKKEKVIPIKKMRRIWHTIEQGLKKTNKDDIKRFREWWATEKQQLEREIYLLREENRNIKLEAREVKEKARAEIERLKREKLDIKQRYENQVERLKKTISQLKRKIADLIPKEGFSRSLDPF